MTGKSRDVPSLEDLKKAKKEEEPTPPVANPVHSWEPTPEHELAKVWTPNES